MVHMVFLSDGGFALSGLLAIDVLKTERSLVFKFRVRTAECGIATSATVSAYYRHKVEQSIS